MCFGILFSWQQLLHCLQFESSIKCVLLATKREKLQIPKTILPLGTKLWFKKDLLSSENKCSCLHALTRPQIWLNMCQKKFIKSGKWWHFYFCLSLAKWSVWAILWVACNILHLWTSPCQVSLCLYKNVVNDIKPSQLKNCLVLVDMKNTIGCLGNKS